MKKTNQRIVILLLAAYTVLQVYCINKLSLSYDEPLFGAYGVSILKFQKEKNIQEFDSKLPITALNMLPRAIEQVFHPGLSKSGVEANRDLIRGRYISLLASLLLALLVYQWSKKIYGQQTALCSLLLFLLCPNFLAHGILVSSDIFAVLFFTSTFYFLWKYRQNGKLRFFLLMSFSTALAQISKFSMLHLFILVPVLLFLTRRQAAFSINNKTKPVMLCFLFFFINWFIISASHFFYQEFMMFGNYEFKSNAFISLQKSLVGISHYLPVPLPSSYLSSLDIVMYYDKLGGGVPGSLNGEPYILGEHSRYGFWYYYFVTLFYKLPIPTLLILLFSIIILFFKKINTQKSGLIILLPVLYYLFYLSFFYATHVGIRHLMIIFPLMYIGASFFFKYLIENKKRWVFFLLAGWQVISITLYFPHFLPYTNEFIPDKKIAYKKIADSNLCYGEGARFLEKYLQENRDAVYLPAKPTAGKIIMEVNELLNMKIASIGKYDWPANLKPVSHIHSQYLVFNVSKEVVDSLSRLRP